MPGTIAIRLPNWLGDTVMAVPALAAVRATWPEARVLHAGPWASALAGQGLADVLVTYPRAWSGRLRTADEVRRFGAEVAILLPNSLEAALAAWYWGAARRIGYAAGGRGLFLTDEVARAEPRAHQIDEYLDLVARAGARVGARVPALRPPPPESEARREVRRLLAEAGERGRGRRWIGVHLGAAYGPAKLWPLDRVTAFCRLLAREGAVAVLLGAPSDAPAAARVLRDARAVSLVGRDRPDLLAAELVEIDALVAGDTGVGHLAAALGTPVIALFGPTDPALSAPRGRVATLTHPVPCAPCLYRRCPIDHPCLAGVEPEEVRRRAWALLEPAA
jgi:heptosyltransferase-2